MPRHGRGHSLGTLGPLPPAHPPETPQTAPDLGQRLGNFPDIYDSGSDVTSSSVTASPRFLR